MTESASTRGRSPHRSDALAKAAYLAAVSVVIAFFGYVAGSFTMYTEAFPSGFFADAYRGGLALLEQKTRYTEPYPSELWQPARTEQRGVTVHNTSRAMDGLTLYTSGHAQKAFLISMTGEVVHEWQLPFSEIWEDSAAVADPQPNRNVFYDKAYMYPNGDLLIIYTGIGDTPWGYGLVKIDRDSKVLWKFLERAHHDMAVSGDGTVYTLTHEITTHVIRWFEHLKPPRIDDFVVLLSKDGEVIRKVSVLDAFTSSPYSRLLNTVPWFSAGDYLHTNAVRVVDREMAAVLPFATEGQILLSMRETGTIAVLDLETEQIVWALRGPWIGQHDPDVLADGNMLLFDNYGSFGPAGGLSRVIEFDPVSLEIAWSYAGTKERPLESILRSGQQRLANGNTLITESDGGRLIEVARDGEVVWEFVNPVRAGEKGELIPVVSVAQRIDPDTLDPEFLGP
jgi:outer membrane protein assembly factor BamB